MRSISNREFDEAVTAALDSLPAEFRSYLENVIIEVRERPDAALMAEYDMPEDVLGFYAGVPLDHRSVDDAARLPDRIFIFRTNLIVMCESTAELIAEIRITLLHEIGHHFGIDEARLEELGYD
jgi:predicted Zn-dependent protease with MMP-like domain